MKPLASNDSLHRDPLTGLGDHAKLIADLTRALEPGSPAAIFAVFALVGWGDYERRCGELAGNRLIMRCATQLARVIDPVGVCYRSRRDELAALIRGSIDVASTALFGAESALSAEGGDSLVSAWFGAVVLPDEADDPVELLMLADQRVRLRIGVPTPRERRHGREPAG
jgi:GGDEF domain-containing protein